jgi:hypothetical protein
LPTKIGDAFAVGGKVFGFGLGAVTITFMTLFLVIDLPNLSRSLHSVLYPRESARTAALEERITRTIGRYAIGAVVIATIAGTVQGTAAWILGVPFALALGIIAGLLGLIPQVGATLAAVVLSLVASRRASARGHHADRLHRLPAGRELRAPADHPGSGRRHLGVFVIASVTWAPRSGWSARSSRCRSPRRRRSGP